MLRPPILAYAEVCKWVFKTELRADGTLDRLKARLVAKGFHQEEGLDFFETFSSVVKSALNGLKQAPRAWFEKFNCFLLDYGHTIILLLYVDDIILMGDLDSHLDMLVRALGRAFPMKDLGPLHYFLGVEITRTSNGSFLLSEYCWSVAISYSNSTHLSYAVNIVCQSPTPIGKLKVRSSIHHRVLYLPWSQLHLLECPKATHGCPVYY
ncbi:hypothetical protein CRG98_040851 [Punica granatum]|uniref:Reverse transcriptase Ty1/copia-type domain-containing protein n=1 Tax=Punica granatum TaxID=22663 RepID=A0A2I0I441_PUNGR|nr:hypothetical protein CRG98_040851 [Punica granatum]